MKAKKVNAHSCGTVYSTSWISWRRIRRKIGCRPKPSEIVNGKNSRRESAFAVLYFIARWDCQNKLFQFTDIFFRWRPSSNSLVKNGQRGCECCAKSTNVNWRRLTLSLPAWASGIPSLSHSSVCFILRCLFSALALAEASRETYPEDTIEGSLSGSMLSLNSSTSFPAGSL